MVNQGIHLGLGMAEYHDWKLDKENLIEGPISCSMLKRFDENPYAWLKSPEMKQTDAMRKGSLFDAALTDPDSLNDLLGVPEKPDHCVILPFDDLRTKDAREWKKEHEAIGERVLKQSDYDKEQEAYKDAMEKIEQKRDHLSKAVREVYSHPIASKILKDAEFQVGVVGEVGGIPAKCLLDILPSEGGDYSEAIADYKTISTGLSNDSIRRAIGKFKYHWQSGFYRTLFNKVHEDRLCDDFYFIFQCVNTLEVRVVKLNEDALSLGTRAVGRAIKDFLKCAHEGIKSRYLEDSDEMGLMPYHEMDEEESLAKRDGIEGLTEGGSR
jgi:hypothetical protein